MKDIGWGIAAAGAMARTLGAVIASQPGMRVSAVGARDLGRAAALASFLGAERSYGSYAEVCADPAVDVVYVTTPHAQHLEVVETAIAHGKAVLCEKPLTATLAQAERMVALARDAGVFLMEAMWMRFNPLIRRIAAEERFGEIREVRASLGVAAPYDPGHRLWQQETGGGALLELGGYPLGLAHLLLGPPTGLRVTGSLKGEVDAEAKMSLTFPGWVRAEAEVSLLRRLPNSANVIGTDLRADILPPFWAPRTIILSGPSAPAEQYVLGPVDGYVAEVLEVQSALAEGRTESPIMPLDDSLAMMRLLEQARHQLPRSHT
ncbi:Gfo/Idh/MocA family oxidoreductase [Nonomuraea sp. NPDC050691]|uniref:Gfo/Idh/MocA family protein n=1 Tax=Nonomuraea sp. NPDC050691 TaxID=3155661 RepID=UPI0033F93276